MRILTPYAHTAGRKCDDVCRVSESLVCSAVCSAVCCATWYGTCILTPYAYAAGLVLEVAAVCVGCQRVLCSLLHGITRVFSHPTSVQRQDTETSLAMVCVGCQRVLCFLLHGIVCYILAPYGMYIVCYVYCMACVGCILYVIFSHPTAPYVYCRV